MVQIPYVNRDSKKYGCTIAAGRRVTPGVYLVPVYVAIGINGKGELEIAKF